MQLIQPNYVKRTREVDNGDEESITRLCSLVSGTRDTRPGVDAHSGASPEFSIPNSTVTEPSCDTSNSGGGYTSEQPGELSSTGSKDDANGVCAVGTDVIAAPGVSIAPAVVTPGVSSTDDASDASTGASTASGVDTCCSTAASGVSTAPTEATTESKSTSKSKSFDSNRIDLMHPPGKRRRTMIMQDTSRHTFMVNGAAPDAAPLPRFRLRAKQKSCIYPNALG